MMLYVPQGKIVLRILSPLNASEVSFLYDMRNIWKI